MKPPFEGEVLRSASFEYHSQSSGPVCPTLMPLLERHLAWFEDFTGLRLTPPAFKYYRFSSYSDMGPYGCPEDCTRDDVIYAVPRFKAHELVHAYLYRAFGAFSIGLLDEGLATAFACDPPRNSLGYDAFDWRSLLHFGESSDDPTLADAGDRYAAAGAFVAYLVHGLGWDKMAAFHRRLTRGADAAAVDEAARSVYGRGMDALWTDFESSPNNHACITEWVCWSSPLVLNEDTAQECDGDVHRTLVLSVPSRVAVLTNYAITLWQDCLSEDGPRAVLGQEIGATITWVGLPAGEFSLTHASIFKPLPRAYPNDFSFRLLSQVSGDVIASACEEAPTFPLDPQVETDILLPSAPNLSGWMRVDAPAGALFSVATNQLITDLSVSPAGAVHGDISFCDSCGAAACQSIQPGADSTIAGSGFLRLSNVYAVAFPKEGYPNVGFRITPIP